MQKKVIKGKGASMGEITGKVKIMPTFSSAKKKFEEGCIIVTLTTSPIWVPYMKKAKAIITEEGGLLSHAAIVSRELGIPCIVGVKEATKILKDNQEVSLNGQTGEIVII